MRVLAGLLTAFLLFTCSFQQLAAQDDGIEESAMPKKAEQWYNKANEYYLYEKYADAKNLLLKTVKKYPRFAKAYARLGEIHWKLNEYAEARAAYLKILNISNTPGNVFMVNYSVGKLWLEERNFEEASHAFTAALNVNTPERWKDKRTQAEWWLENARFAAHAIKNPVPFNPILLDSTVNSRHDEYLPMVTADEEMLVFTRRFKSNVDANEDFFFSTKDSDTSAWNMAIEMDRPINSPANEGAICISPDGKRLFFAANGRPDSEGGFDLYYCMKSGNTWKGPYNLGTPVNTPAWESQPSISADGRWLYFCSRRKGGYGGIDLWVSYLSDNNYWTEPVNLGPNINSPKDEQSPFIHPDNQTLYFSSNGHIGMGGADLYVVRRDSTGKWSKPENLGYPINTPDTENGLIVNARGNRAYYSSFNKDFGLDIYYFNLPKAVQPNYVTYVKGTVFDDISRKKLSATIELIDLETGKTLQQTVSDPVNGEFLVTLPSGKNYMYNVSKTDYLFFSENFSLKDNNPDKPYLLNIALKPIQKDKKDDKPVWNVGQSVVLKNVFFDTDSYQLQPASFSELDRLVKLLQDYPSLKVEIGGHTDNVGTREYNQKLSANRAKAVYDYLVEKGIPAKQLSHKGYADTKPIAGNDTEAGRAANRRTEFTILDGVTSQQLSQPQNGSSVVNKSLLGNSANLLKNALAPANEQTTPQPPANKEKDSKEKPR
ncbi:hypothetical protein C7N43_36610 [Sphingobacteriales bacterium UPWRP_1]|nr:hypothetical protein C7N43_36610 [Sphingobacteriales bacterium UPWRP_1]